MIRTEDEYRAAQQRLDQEQAILRSRAFTDDEQHNFNALVADIEHYSASAPGPAATRTLPASPAAPPPPPPASPAPATALSSSVSSASMEKELARMTPNLLADNMRRRVEARAAADAPTSGGVLGLRADLVADMRARHPEANGAAMSASSMQRELRRAGMQPVGVD